MSVQGDFDTYVANANLDLWLGGVVPAPPATLYFGLSTGISPHLGAAIVEPAGGGYARVAVPNTLSNFPAAVNRQKANGVTITCPAPTADWGTLLSWFAITTAAGAGQVFASGTLATPLTVKAGDPAPSFAPGTLVFAN